MYIPAIKGEGCIFFMLVSHTSGTVGASDELLFLSCRKAGEFGTIWKGEVCGSVLVIFWGFLQSFCWTGWMKLQEETPINSLIKNLIN